MSQDPGYYYSGPVWFFADYYAKLPPLMGGGPQRSRPYFDRALEKDGNTFLWGKLLFARDYAVAVQDRILFEDTLHDVINRASSSISELKLVNTVAARKAGQLLTQADELF